MNRLKESYSGCMNCGGKVKMKSGGNWIKGAIKKPGSFTAQANKAGMSVPAFRNKVLSNKGAYSSTTVKRANLAKTLAGMRKAEDGMVNSNQPKPKPTLVVRWKDNVKNPENQEFVSEVAFNKKKGPNYDVSKQDIAKVTQEEFNQRYNIQKDSMVYPPKISRKKLNKK